MLRGLARRGFFYVVREPAQRLHSVPGYSGVNRFLRFRTTDQYPDSDKTGHGSSVMSWIILIVSGVLEAVWATALGKSMGFTKLWPTVVFAGALLLSMAGLAMAMRTIPVGTAYAVWVGIGASLTVLYAMIFGGEPASLLKILLILGLVGCVIGLKLVDGGH